MLRLRFCMQRVALGGVGLLSMLSAVNAAELSPDTQARLLKAYPAFLERIEGNTLIWRDGTRMSLDDGKGAKVSEDDLNDADIEDMFATPYVPFGEAIAPPMGSDPGRARNAALFQKMYGDCTAGETAKRLIKVEWLPKKRGGSVMFAAANGAAEALKAVSAELDELPQSFDTVLIPNSGTYICRVIAGTPRVSAHGYGIAIDLATKHSDYWRWGYVKGRAGIAYRNRIPLEIVRIFEKHGFIWGGRWHHFDTMHFEYRPELVGR